MFDLNTNIKTNLLLMEEVEVNTTIELLDYCYKLFEIKDDNIPCDISYIYYDNNEVIQKIEYSEKNDKIVLVRRKIGYVEEFTKLKHFSYQFCEAEINQTEPYIYLDMTKELYVIMQRKQYIYKGIYITEKSEEEIKYILYQTDNVYGYVMMQNENGEIQKIKYIDLINIKEYTNQNSENIDTEDVINTNGLENVNMNNNTSEKNSQYILFKILEENKDIEYLHTTHDLCDIGILHCIYRIKNSNFINYTLSKIMNNETHGDSYLLLSDKNNDIIKQIDLDMGTYEKIKKIKITQTIPKKKSIFLQYIFRIIIVK
jgi:hypothetical protein